MGRARSHRAAAALLALSITGCYGTGKATDAQTPGTQSPGAQALGALAPGAGASGYTATGKFYGSGQTAFQNTTYKLASAHCAACHGMRQAPLFAATDVAAAYAALLAANKVDFTAIAHSALLRTGGKLSDHHCGSYCDGAAVTAWQSSFQDWWNGGECLKTNACGKNTSIANNGRFNTASQTVPAALPTAPNTFVTMSFPLDALNSDITGAVFFVDIQQYRTSNGYLLRKPRITIPAAATYSIAVRDIQIAVNNSIDSNATTYQVVDQTVSAPGGELLSLSPLIVTQLNGSGADQLAVSFGTFKSTSDVCHNLAGFSANVQPVLLANCASCHGTQTTFRINAADNSADLCARSLLRINRSQPSLSQLIRLPKYGDLRRDGTAHNKPAGFTEDDVSSFLDWIATE